MTKISRFDIDALFLKQTHSAPITLSGDVYKLRLQKLVALMTSQGLTHVLLYADREHFSNVEYFSRFDPRFEEALMIVDSHGTVSMVLGNECYEYSMNIPYPVTRYLYQNFSLQGQPRESSQPLTTILYKTGISKISKVGIVGYKYFYFKHCTTDPLKTYDVPAFIVEAVFSQCPNAENITQMITGVPYGIRSRLYCAEEIAWAEAQGNRCASVVQRMLKNLKVGIKEYELPMLANVGFDPTNVHPLCNFGSASIGLGLRSPTDNALEMGEACGICYGIRGNLTARSSIAALDLKTCRETLQPYVERFYMKHFEAMVAWYEALKLGCTGGDLYAATMQIIGADEFGVTLNPGHNTGTDEWSNSPCYEGSVIEIMDGAFMQADIIATATYPNRTAICEDAVVVASPELQNQLKEQYPDTYARIKQRQAQMRDVFHIAISDDVLPMSNLNGAYFPFMLDTHTVFVHE